MVNVLEAVYKNGKVLADNANIPDNSKVIIIWENNKSIDENTIFNKKQLPKGVLLEEIKNSFNQLENFPVDAVQFQRSLRDGDWN